MIGLGYRGEDAALHKVIMLQDELQRGLFL